MLTTWGTWSAFLESKKEGRRLDDEGWVVQGWNQCLEEKVSRGHKGIPQGQRRHKGGPPCGARNVKSVVPTTGWVHVWLTEMRDRRIYLTEPDRDEWREELLGAKRLASKWVVPRGRMSEAVRARGWSLGSECQCRWGTHLWLCRVAGFGVSIKLNHHSIASHAR